jgi:hypothetical protein
MRVSRVSLAFLFMGPWIASSSAQTINASIVGDVTDSPNSPVPQAKISVRNAGTRALREVPSSDTGAYRLYPLDPGKYDITISKPGFRTQAVQGVTVDVDATVRLDFKLEVRAVGESVNVPTRRPCCRRVGRYRIDPLTFNTSRYAPRQ